ncbi:MAG: hypothetical protein ACSLE0_21585 [Chitinophagaceae bacterium]
MISIFKQKNPANLLLLLLTGVLLKLSMFINPHGPIVRSSEGILYEGIIRLFAGTEKSSPLFYPILTFALLFFQAILITRFINHQRMMNRPSYLAGLSYMMITSLLPEWNYFSAPLLCNTILLFILSGLLGIYNKQNARGVIFNIGLALGISSFLFISSITFIIWVLLALAVMRPFRINEWLICLLGITTPFYFYAIYIVITSNWNWHQFIPSIQLGFPLLKQSAWLAFSVFLILVPFLAGGYYVQENLRRMLINVRKGWSLLLLYLLTALLLPFVNSSDTFENWIMAMIPMAAFHGFAYLHTNWRLFPRILFWLTTVFILVYQYVGPGW